MSKISTPCHTLSHLRFLYIWSIYLVVATMGTKHKTVRNMLTSKHAFMVQVLNISDSKTHTDSLVFPNTKTIKLRENYWLHFPSVWLQQVMQTILPNHKTISQFPGQPKGYTVYPTVNWWIGNPNEFLNSFLCWNVLQRCNVEPKNSLASQLTSNETTAIR